MRVLGFLRQDQPTRKEVERLLPLLRDSSTRQEVGRALARLGKPAVEFLIPALDDAAGGVRAGAAYALGEIGDVRAVIPLTRLLHDADDGVRGTVAAALGKLRDPRAVDPLIQALRDADPSVRLLAAGSLGMIRAPRAVETLGQALGDAGNDRDTRALAARSLMEIGGDRAAEMLIQALQNDASWYIRMVAAAMLGPMGEVRAVGPLAQALRDEDENVRRVTNEALEMVQAKVGPAAIHVNVPVVAPPGFEDELAEIQQLDAQKECDPQAIGPLMRAHERILERLPPGEHRAFRAAIQNRLGNLYGGWPLGDPTANLTRAIACYQQVLRVWTPEAAPFDYAGVQNNLGNAYAELPTGDREENLARAIACYQQALRFWTLQDTPLDYARVQIRLGNVYAQRLTGNRTEHLAQTITCCQQALRILSPELPSPWGASVRLSRGLRGGASEYALAQGCLGRAYAQLPTGDRSENLARAIACFQEALRFWTPEAEPFAYAKTQNNLGEAYRELPTGNRRSNLLQAVECYREALRFRTLEAVPFEYAITQNNLGLAYRALGDPARAIACFRQALRVWTPSSAPQDYAMAQNNLGVTVADSDPARAIACYQEALRFCTPETNPGGYALAQNNLGAAYHRLSTGDRPANLARAIACHQRALRFRSPEAQPHNCRVSHRNLAHLYFEQRDWPAALAAYRAALDAGERLYRAGLSAASKSAEAAENAILHRQAAFAAARLGDAAQALLTLERGKTRLLAEALRLRVPRPAGVPDVAWVAFEQAGAAVRAAQSEGPASPGPARDPVTAYAAREQAARQASAALDAAVERVRQHAPGFLQDLDLAAVLDLLPDDRTALVAFCLTDQGSLGLAASRREPVQAVDAPGFTQADLIRLLFAPDEQGRVTGGWVGDYLRRDAGRWPATVDRVLAAVGAGLLAPILTALPSEIEKLVFLPSGGLFLLPLHAVPLADDGSTRVCDRYEVSYAPSAEVLADCRAKLASTPSAGRSLYAAINPTTDPHLAFAHVEGAAIAALFDRRQVHAGAVGTKPAVAAGARGRVYLHFACHGAYHWDDPPQSGLALADEPFTLADLQRGAVDLSAARLVVLSACETGLVDVVQGSAEEYVGLPAGFLLAGVPGVVSSLWAVPDLSTALLMERFYRHHLDDGLGVAAALRAAQIWLRQRATAGYLRDYLARAVNEGRLASHQAIAARRAYDDLADDARPFASPYYWAAFAVYGV